jgi:dTDP-4-amino-4,6-dideoxygalactose transaminase
VDLCVTLEVMLSNEALAASVALVLTIAKVCLNVGSNVLSSSEDFAATVVEAGPLAGCRILLTDVARNLFRCDAGVLEARVHFKVIEELGLREWVHGQAAN